jgi:hypothetical protein
MFTAIVYEMLYRNVFKLDTELTEAVALIRDQNKRKLTMYGNRYPYPAPFLQPVFGTCILYYMYTFLLKDITALFLVGGLLLQG